jgi:sugar phosphate isomerase/epimerase
MNHPARDVMREIEWMAEMGLEFVDLTLEPPAAACWKVNPAEIRKALQWHGLAVVGHTAYYLPLCSAFETLRLAAVEECKRCLEMFSQIGAAWMNLHPDRHAPMHDRGFIIERNIRSIEELLPTARDCGVGLMIENLPGDFNTVAQLSQLLEPLPELGLHLDIGHSNLMVERNTAPEIITVYGSRLRHVHLHDNKGGHADLHLPLGAGIINVAQQVRVLHDAQYDATITLEVFSEDRTYLAHSRDVLRELWEQCAQGVSPEPCETTASAHTCA